MIGITANPEKVTSFNIFNFKWMLSCQKLKSDF